MLDGYFSFETMWEFYALKEWTVQNINTIFSHVHDLSCIFDIVGQEGLAFAISLREGPEASKGVFKKP